MFCENCGAKLDDDALFCVNCGTRIQQETDSGTDPAPTPVPSPTPVSSPAATPVAAPVPALAQEDTTPNRKPIFIAAIAVICMLIVVIAGMLILSQAQKNERTHANVQVPITFNFATEGPNDPIGVPLLIQGTDLDNNHFEQRYLSPVDGGSVELKAGSYTVTVAGPTPNTSGQVYKVQNTSAFELDVPVPDEDGDEQQQDENQSDISFTFTSVLPQDLTDDEIEEMKEWMEEFDVDPVVADETMNAVTVERDKELARIKLEQEKQAALNANPSVLTGNGTEIIPGVTLTGTVKIGTFYGKSDSVKDIAYLQLPGNISAQNVWYRVFKVYTTSVEPIDCVELGDSFSQYIGKTVSVSGDIEAFFTRGPACSTIMFVNARVTRVFE